jgi:hypothetical protein
MFKNMAADLMGQATLVGSSNQEIMTKQILMTIFFMKITKNLFPDQSQN